SGSERSTLPRTTGTSAAMIPSAAPMPIQRLRAMGHLRGGFEACSTHTQRRPDGQKKRRAMARAAHLASDYASQERRESPRRLSTPSSPSGHEPSPRSPEHPHPDASLSPAAPNDATPDDVGTPAIAETSESPVTSAEQTVVASLEVADTQVLQQLCGPRSALLAELARHSGADVSQRGNVIRISGAPEDTRVAQRFLEDAAQLIHQGVDVNLGDVGHSVRTLRRDPERSLVELLDQVIIVTSRSRPVAPKTATQREYIAAIRSHDLTFGIGPAGTGKTYLAMAM